jgi:hypothetical protein
MWKGSVTVVAHDATSLVADAVLHVGVRPCFQCVLEDTTNTMRSQWTSNNIDVLDFQAWVLSFGFLLI